MRRQTVRNAYQKIQPTQQEKDRMLDEILTAYEGEVQKCEAKPRVLRFRIWQIAAVLSILICLVGCTAAVLSLNDLRLGEYRPADSENQSSGTVLSLQGIVGSKNYQANKEWLDFSNSYKMPDSGELSLEQRIAYLSYGVYFQDQIDKIDEICEKYGLKLLGHEWIEPDIQTVFDAIGIDGVFNGESAEIVLNEGYYYSNGTFSIGGTVRLVSDTWSHPIPFSFRCSMKDALDTVCLHIRDMDSYTQWHGSTGDDTEVLMAMNQDHAFLIADKKDFFVTVTIPDVKIGDIYRGEERMDKTVIEALAKVFDFSFHPQPVDVKAAEKRYEELSAELEVQRRENETNWREDIGKESYDARVQVLLENSKLVHKLGYVFSDLDGDGAEELLIGHDGVFGAIYTYKNGETYSPLPSDGTSVYYVCENNVIACISSGVNIDIINYWYVKIQGTGSQCLDLISYNKVTDQWRQVKAVHSDGTACDTFDPYDFSIERIEEQITAEQAKAIRDQYTVTKLDTLPLMQYPLPEKSEVEDFLSGIKTQYTNYADLAADFLLNAYKATEYDYILSDIDGNGVEELLLSLDGTIRYGYTMIDGTVYEILDGMSNYYVYENGMILQRLDYSDKVTVYAYYKLDGMNLLPAEYLRFDGSWRYSEDASGQDVSLQTITKGEAENIMARYSALEFVYRPLVEFPFQ